MKQDAQEATRLIQAHIYEACHNVTRLELMDDTLEAHPRLVIDPIDGISLIDDRDVTARDRGRVSVTYFGRSLSCIDTGVHWFDSAYLLPFLSEWYSEHQTTPDRDPLAKDFIDSLVLPAQLRDRTARFFHSI